MPAQNYLNNVGATLKGEALKDADIEYKVGDGKWSKDVPSATNVADSLKEISVRVTLKVIRHSRSMIWRLR